MSRMSKGTFRAALCATVVLAAAGAAGASAAQGLPPLLQLPETPWVASGGLTVYPVRGGLYMITGPAANTLVSVGREGVLVVDPPPASVLQPFLAEVRKLSDKPIRFVLNTTGDPDHVGGNQAVADVGEPLSAGGNDRPDAISGAGGARIWAHEGVLSRLSAGGGEPVGWPTDTYFVAAKDMFVNGDAVEMVHVPAAHTNGDSFVVFRRTDVIAVGDVYTPDRYPKIDLEHGGSIEGLLAGINSLLQRTIPQFNQEGGTLVVPGHGRLSDEGDVAEYRDMVTIVRDRIKNMISKKMTLAQVKAARPTLEYDVLYGAPEGEIFVEQIYRSLTKPAKPKDASGAGE